MTTQTETRNRDITANAEKNGPAQTAEGGKGAQTPASRRPAPNARQVISPLPGIFAAPPGVLMNAFLRNPWTFIRFMQDEMDRDFPTNSRADGSAPRPRDVGDGIEARTAWTPALEVFRRENDLVVHAELPGLRTDDIDVSVQDDTLVISGERKQQHEHTRDGMYRSERRYGSFQRGIPLPEGVNEEQISASFSDGVLEVRVPLPEPATKSARKIKIS